MEFASNGDEPWVGNFAKYCAESPSSVHADLGSRAVVVVAGGAGYVVDTQERRLVREIGFDIRHIWFDIGIQAMVMSNGLRFEAFDAHAILWRIRRFSWDGIRNVESSGAIVTGEAPDPMSEQWIPFRLELSTGDVQGGSYNGPAM